MVFENTENTKTSVIRKLFLFSEFNVFSVFQNIENQTSSLYFPYFSYFLEQKIVFKTDKQTYSKFVENKRGHYVNLNYFLLFFLKKGNEKNGDEGHLHHKVR